MQASSLPIDLRLLASHLHRCAISGVGLAPSECEQVATLIRQGAQEADALVAQASLLPEIEDELHAVAADLGEARPVPVQPGYQAALKAQQREIQQRLDAAGPEPVSRPGLAALAMRIGDSNVTAFPVAPRPRGPFDGEDGCGGGDAA